MGGGLFSPLFLNPWKFRRIINIKVKIRIHYKNILKYIILNINVIIKCIIYYYKMYCIIKCIVLYYYIMYCIIYYYKMFKKFKFNINYSTNEKE